MSNYLREVATLLDSILEIKPLTIETPIVIYGAGNSGRKAQQLLQKSGYSILGFLDKNSKRTPIDALPCVLPDSDCASKWCGLNATVVIAVLNPQADSREINQSLAHFPWNRIITFPQFVELFHHRWGNHFWVTHRDLYKDATVRKVLLQTAELWKDQASRDCFKAVLKARLCGRTDELDDLVRTDQQPQYFPNDIPCWPTPTNFVDCGAFNGDTLREIPLRTLKSVAAFEPDMENFQALISSTRMSSQFGEKGVKVLLWPCGVWSETTTLNFNAEQDASSHIVDSGKNRIPVVALDEVLQGLAPNFIKMDIEGAEPEALQGAFSLINKYHPALAICAYHRPAHLWEILQLINSWQCGYEFYLRAHQFSGLDVVLYALTKTS